MKLPPRLLTKEHAADYCGLSLQGFDAWVRAGRLPMSIPGTHRWDRKAIDLRLDDLSGIQPDDAADSPLDDWLEKRRASAA